MLCERQGQDGMWPRRALRPFKGKSEPVATSRHPVFEADLFYESLNRKDATQKDPHGESRQFSTDHRRTPHVIISVMRLTTSHRQTGERRHCRGGGSHAPWRSPASPLDCC